MAHDHRLDAMPEEILVMIFKECFADQAFGISKRKSNSSESQEQDLPNPVQAKEAPAREFPGNMSILLVSKAFFRIALPQFYATATFRYSRSFFKKTNCLQKQDIDRVKPQRRLRNIYFKHQPIEDFKIKEGASFWLLEQIDTIRLELGLYYKSFDHLELLHKLVGKCQDYNVYLEVRMRVFHRGCKTNGPDSRYCWPHLRLIVDTDGGSELVAAHMIDQDFFDGVKSKIDAMFGCDLATLKFKAGKRRIVRVTDLARSRWDKFGTRF